jgi:two-component system chemotaxis response regulator CheB
MITILIADDSATETALLKYIFEAEKDMRVIGSARNGIEAVKLAKELKPDLITMDIQMPIMNGFEATQLIMMNNPVPIVVISSALNNTELDTTFLALEAGAVSVIEKPTNALDPSEHLTRKRMTDIIRSMAEIKVVTRRYSTNKPIMPVKADAASRHFDILAIGASVGGPQALKTILSLLPENFPIPIAIVQHITPGFLQGFCSWLNQNCRLTIKIADNKETLLPGFVYFAKENAHLEVIRIGNDLVAHYRESPPVAGFCPSITVLLQSIAKSCGKDAIGVLLTGMGRDGAEGLLELKQKKGLTIVQDEKSSVVFGMGKVAESMGAVDEVVPLDEMVNCLLKRVVPKL